MIISETGKNGVKSLVFKTYSPSIVSKGVGKYKGDEDKSSKQRAVAILRCYGGFEKYKATLASNLYTVLLIEDPTGGSSVSGINRILHLGDFPLQIFPDGSPLFKLKQAIAEIDEDLDIQPIRSIRFTQDCELSKRQILEIQKNQKRVVRFAVKSDCPAQLQELRSGDDTSIRQKCFTDKESPGKKLERVEYGLMSSYITPLKLYLHQSGAQAGTRVQDDKEATIYYTGFGYPVFDEEYIKAISGDEQQKKDELKAIFKQQIFAVLLARSQQIEYGEIGKDTKVPLVLNRPFDFMRVESLESAKSLREFVNKSLCELFREQEVVNAMMGKIDQVLIWDPESDIYARDTSGQKIGQSLGTTKFFDNLGNFREIFQDSKYKLKEQGSFIEVVDATGADMISIARCYEEYKGIKLAIPGMVNPTYQDGEGAMIGIGATEESLYVASLGMMQIYLNSLHNQSLGGLEILDSGSLQRFTTEIKEVGGGSGGAAQESSLSTPNFQDNLKSYGLPIVAGLAGAGAVVLCASALGIGIVSAPVVTVAVVVGVACVGATATAVLMEQNKKTQKSK